MPSILITSANRGLGLEFARQYAADGWRTSAVRPQQRKQFSIKFVLARFHTAGPLADLRFP
jgi:NAD(P)-dependent dehydrogenase (short-subunit alcohol dehydrogenase family)